MAEHTKEPWAFVPWHIEEGPSAVRAPEGWLICTTSSDANARRIVACVNALAGIPDPAAFVQAARGMREALESLLKECWEDQHSHMTRDFFERHYKDELAALTAFDAAMGEGQSDE